MNPSKFNPYALISQKYKAFEIVGLQTDQKIFVGNEVFTALKSNDRKKRKNTSQTNENIKCKRAMLFNGGKILGSDNQIKFSAKNQGDHLKFINTTLPIKQV